VPNGALRLYQGLDASATSTLMIFVNNPAMAAAAGYSLPIVCTTDGCNNPSSGACTASTSMSTATATASVSALPTPASCSTNVPAQAVGGLSCWVGDVFPGSPAPAQVFNANWVMCLAVNIMSSGMPVVRRYQGMNSSDLATAIMFFSDATAAAAAGYSRAIVCATAGCNGPSTAADIACSGMGTPMPPPTPTSAEFPCTNTLPTPAPMGLSCWSGYVTAGAPAPVLVQNSTWCVRLCGVWGESQASLGASNVFGMCCLVGSSMKFPHPFG